MTLHAQALTPLSPVLQLSIGEKMLGLLVTTLTLKQEQTHILNIDFHLSFPVRTALHQFNTTATVQVSPEHEARGMIPQPPSSTFARLKLSGCTLKVF